MLGVDLISYVCLLGLMFFMMSVLLFLCSCVSSLFFILRVGVLYDVFFLMLCYVSVICWILLNVMMFF